MKVDVDRLADVARARREAGLAIESVTRRDSRAE
jgi:hypothetical protein